MNSTYSDPEKHQMRYCSHIQVGRRRMAKPVDPQSQPLLASADCLGLPLAFTRPIRQDS